MEPIFTQPLSWKEEEWPAIRKALATSQSRERLVISKTQGTSVAKQRRYTYHQCIEYMVEEIDQHPQLVRLTFQNFDDLLGLNYLWSSAGTAKSPKFAKFWVRSMTTGSMPCSISSLP